MRIFQKNKRALISVLCTILLLSAVFAAPVWADEEPNDFGQFYGIVNAESLNVRASASMDAEVIATLSAGQYVRVNWIEPGWVNVAYNNDGLMGYVSDEFFTVYEGTVPNHITSGAGNLAVQTAKKYLGIPYVWGGTTPAGFDCSGLMQYVYREIGYNISRTTYTQIYDGIPVSLDQMVPGDLIFFGSASAPHHVGMYIGNGQYLHAPHTGDVVKISDLGYRSDACSARRIIY